MTTSALNANNLTRRAVLLTGAAATVSACGDNIGPTPDGDASSDTPGTDTPNDQFASSDVLRDAVQDVSSQTDGAQEVGQDAGPDVPASSCPPTGAMRLGTLIDFPEGSWRSVSKARVIVGRDERGLFAYTFVCTHNGCAVPAPTSRDSGSRCLCHGSRYDGEGMVTEGPATQSLANYRVFVCGGDVYVLPNRVVPLGTRTPA